MIITIRLFEKKYELGLVCRVDTARPSVQSGQISHQALSQMADWGLCGVRGFAVCAAFDSLCPVTS